MMVFGLLVFTFTAYAGAPTDTAKAGVDKVIAVAGDKTLTDDNVKKEKIQVVKKQD